MSDRGESTTEAVSADGVLPDFARSPTSRRAFIKGVIASGAAVPAAGFIMRGHGMPSAFAQASGAVERLVTLNVMAVIGGSMCCRRRRCRTPCATSSA
jgi:hypothetical protein